MARSEVCKNCCPHGGAIFTEEFGCFQHVTTKEWMEDAGWKKVCNNCGHYKERRKTKPRLTLDEIIALPDADGLRNCGDIARFHYFSDAGVIPKYRATCQQYADLAKKNGITKYALYLHPYFNDYHIDKLSDAIRAKRPSARDVRYNVREMEKLLAKAEAALESDFLRSEAA